MEPNIVCIIIILCVCVPVWRPQDDSGCCSLGTVHLWLRDRLSHWLRTLQVDETSCPTSPKEQPVSTSPGLELQVYITTWL